MIAIGMMLKAASGILKEIPWQVYAGVALLAGGIFYGHLRYNAGQADVQGKFDDYKAQVTSDIAKQEAINKAKEAKDKAAFDLAKQALEKRNADTQANADRTIADLRAGTIKLRQRFVCPARAAEVAGSPKGSDGAGQIGFLGEDAQFLIRFAGDADKSANRLTACQAILTAERQ